MSVINNMLLELDRRQGHAEGVARTEGPLVRSIAPEPPSRSRRYLLGVAALVAVGFVVALRWSPAGVDPAPVAIAPVAPAVLPPAALPATPAKAELPAGGLKLDLGEPGEPARSRTAPN